LTVVEFPSLILPDISKENLEIFVKSACDLYGEPPNAETIEIIQEAMSILCIPFKV
jgi:hypothetical protein